jgi:hypothetical protein
METVATVPDFFPIVARRISCIAFARGRKMALMSGTTVTEHPKGEMQVKFKAFIERITWYSLEHR